MYSGLFVGLLLLGLNAPHTHALEFLLGSPMKCVHEQAETDVIVVIDFKAYSKTNPDQPIDLNFRVEDPKFKILYQQQGKSSGHYAVTTTMAGEYRACFSSIAMNWQQVQDVMINLSWQVGVAATDWGAIAKQGDSLESLAGELVKLEQTVRDLRQEMFRIRSQEEVMRNVNENVNSQVAWFSIGSLLVCVASGALQLYFLRRLFVRKKLL